MPHCKFIKSCLYYLDISHGMTDYDKQRYCHGDYECCERYKTFKLWQEGQATPYPQEKQQPQPSEASVTPKR